MPFKKILKRLFTSKRTSEKREVRWVSAAELIPGPIQHERLTEEQMMRVQRLHIRLTPIDGMSLQERIDSFKRDFHLERELSLMEKIADVCEQAFRELESLTLEQRREIYGLAIMMSSSTATEVLKHFTPRTITIDQAKHVLGLFSGLFR